MKRFLRILGFAWAWPVTMWALMYVGIFNLFGWYKHLGVRGDSLVWVCDLSAMPKWLAKLWAGWAGHTIGNVVVLRDEPDTDRMKTVLVHEQEHVRQYMVLGVFMLPLYALSWLVIKVAFKRSHPYYSNPFEVEARRAADQTVDVEKTLSK